jgi:hypothetical protein
MLNMKNNKRLELGKLYQTGILLEIFKASFDKKEVLDFLHTFN